MPLVILFAVALGILRAVGVTHIAFQAVAHLFLGGVIVAACYAKLDRWKLIFVAAGLSVLEVICFFTLR